MKREILNRISLEYFSNSDITFWMRPLQDLLYEYPDLEDEMAWDTFGLMYISSGDGTVNLDGYKIRMDEPKIVIFKIGSVSKIEISRNAEGILICFKEEFFNLRYTNNILSAFSFLQQGAKSYMRPKTDQVSKIEQLIQFMWQEFSSTTRDKDKILRSYLNIILFEIQNNFSKLSQNTGLESINETIVRFERLVNQQFIISRSPSYYAKQLFISENYLNRLCNRYRHKTAGDIIRDRVYLEAQRLLQHTQMSISEISEQLGFDSASYFTTFFKKKFTLTPEEFRSKNL